MYSSSFTWNDMQFLLQGAWTTLALTAWAMLIGTLLGVICGLARALLHHAPILLLDEPTSAMDFSTEAEVTRQVGAFAKGKTVVLVTHRTSMLSLVDRVIVVDGGKIVADGPRDTILQALSAGRISRAA